CSYIFLSLGRSALPSTLFPYTTLFRSGRGAREGWDFGGGHRSPVVAALRRRGGRRVGQKDQSHRLGRRGLALCRDWLRDRGNHRSEEHTSELQSLRHLVCRLLLEKKKK